jgi:hydroxymethylpyrimidine/phosphomethylpyrimidine kinase
LVANALSISWSDPTGCDGVAADLRTFGAFAVHGAAVIAGMRSNSRLAMIEASEIQAQIKAAASAMGAIPVKQSFLGLPGIDAAITNALRTDKPSQIVLDASSSATAGPPSTEAVEMLKTSIASDVALLVTDVAGAQALSGVKIANQTGLRAVARLLRRYGPRFVLVTGSQLTGDEVVDIMSDGKQTWEFPGERFPAPEPAGLSATYTSAITAGLAHGRSVEESVAVARIYVTEAERSTFAPQEGRPIASQLYAWWSGPGRQGYGG